MGSTPAECGRCWGQRARPGWRVTTSPWTKTCRCSEEGGRQDYTTQHTELLSAADTRVLTTAIIGSPNISLFSNGATIEVSIKDPVFAVSSLRNVYISATYNISYWKDGQKEKAKHISNVQQNRVVLSDLDPRTKYCVQVQINTESNPHPSKPSGVVCASTTREDAPWVAAVLTFVLMAVGVALVVVLVVYRESISVFFCPKDALPQHFKEYLLAPPNSTIYLAMRNSHPPKEVYHQISILADHRTEEEGCPLEAARTTCSKQPDISVGGG
ncbi:interleukin-10 receptor subunit beta-like isoform X2 [Trachinotus anak]|uniref:interleukin-10 receptor subunit beta-like isoform X2 n=1 Tax=Trachinotus anak TaxID=443729 RepID=UPI0039F22D91